MEQRIQINQLEPEAQKAMYGLENYLAKSELSATHIGLIKMRASQINGCAFCINMHTKEAIKNNETPKRIFLLDTWKESNLFSEEEMVVLSVTEEITLIHKNGLSKTTYNKALGIFSENYLAQIIMAATIINAWNRIAISTHKPLQN